MARRAGHRLGEHLPVEVEDAGGDVPRLPRAGREGSADQGAGLFLDDREQAVPQDLDLDLAERGFSSVVMEGIG